jgi:ligand-binding SRPBCC domain-containing protein
MRIHVLERQQRIERPLAEVFPFYADAGNLERITPPWLGFEVTTPRPIEMGVGALIEYKLRLHGVPVRWRTRIEAWEPPHRFVDVQLSGPYALWHHTHWFRADGAGATVLGDRVRYAIPFGATSSGSSTTAATRWRSCSAGRATPPRTVPARRPSRPVPSSASGLLSRCRGRRAGGAARPARCSRSACRSGRRPRGR